MNTIPNIGRLPGQAANRKDMSSEEMIRRYDRYVCVFVTHTLSLPRTHTHTQTHIYSMGMQQSGLVIFLLMMKRTMLLQWRDTLRLLRISSNTVGATPFTWLLSRLDGLSKDPLRIGNSTLFLRWVSIRT
jgi:hypothetical protein